MIKQYIASASKAVGILAVASAIAATGCTSNYGSSYLSKAGVLPTTPNSLEIVSQESQKALTAQKMLVKYREAYSDSLDYRQRSFTEEKINVDYIGKPQSLLSSIAIRYGYRFLAYGAERDLPTVNFTQYYGTPENIIVNLDAQLGDSANIAIDKPEKVITLIYAQ